jgi:superfamily II DNA or RNA helicase
VILAGKTTDPAAKVQVASIQTLWSRHKRESGWIPQADLVFIDEAHRATAFTYRSLIRKYPEATVVGSQQRRVGATVVVSAVSLTR